MRFAAHPLWLAGFRPFFILACLSGLSLPALWLMLHVGLIDAPYLARAPLQWHAHEMFFGFGWAVLGGFLLTATKNWVSIRGYHGAALAMLAAAWIIERIGMGFGGAWPAPVFQISNTLFLGGIVAMLLWTLIRYRTQDSYRDNYFFLLILPAFLIAKQLMLDAEHFREGTAMATGLFRVAFLVMLERTLTQFMKGVFQVEVLRHARLDVAIKLLGLALVVAPWLPSAVAGGIAALLALLLGARFCFWYPQLGLRRIDIGIMYLGYLAIVLQLMLEAIEVFAPPAWVGAISTHVFGLGVMGLIIPAMLVRISKGHTGRKVAFDRGDKAVLWIMIAALLLRVVAPQLDAARYAIWLAAAAGGWLVGFGLLALRLTPLLLAPRVDGKAH
ncbi:MAG: NnrS family protein [Rhodocyclales bacterium]|nr:NnrS family protein [Rhodocyclales bacterium]